MHSKLRIPILEKSGVGSTQPSNFDSRPSFYSSFASRSLILNRYWDWADPKVDIEGLPSLFYTEELTILCTGQKSVAVPNPLASFTFPYIPKDFGDDTDVSEHHRSI